MIVKSICDLIEEVAPLSLQESYDNAGLLIGDSQMEINSALVTIDVTEEVIDEAIRKECELIISHHPLIFKGLKNITGQNDVQRCVVKAIKNDIAIYAAHTNLDNVLNGVSGKMAEKIGLKNVRILQPKQNRLLKLITYVPNLYSDKIRKVLFEAGAGQIGNYDSCSFNGDGLGTFRANEKANPFVGNIDELHTEPETRIEVILPDYLKNHVLKALLMMHPYEEPAYDFIPLQNTWKEVGAGVVGELDQPEDELILFNRIKRIFKVPSIRHTVLSGIKVKRVALCGGSGSEFLTEAIAAGADVFITGDFKYHEFFDAQKQIVIADIGHFESEQFTKDIFFEIITKKMPTFAVQISDSKTNPINYL
jgi:dinuclear metal center YbgI/SA1388 family protein